MATTLSPAAIDAPDGLDQAASHRGHMRLLLQKLQVLLRKVRAESDERAARRTDQNIRPDAARAVGHVVQHSAGDPDQCEDHGHLNADRDGAQERPHWPVSQVFNDEFVNQDESLVFMIPGYRREGGFAAQPTT